MRTQQVSTPYGRRAMSLGMVARQMQAEAVPDDAIVHKWHVFHHIKEARELIGATDRALAILNALLSFHPDTAFHGDSALIVWPSNEQLIDRAYGMSPATLRRHLANLVDTGLIIRRDSPNGKRYARKDADGEVEQAFGFDLTPIVARAFEFKGLATATKAKKQALRLAKERVTLTRRDIVKMIETGLEEGVPGDWGAVEEQYHHTVTRLTRSPNIELLEEVAEDLERVWSAARKMLEDFVNYTNLNANESHSERHIQNSNPEPITESESGLGLKEEEPAAGDQTNVRRLPERELPLGIVLEASPKMLWLVKDGSGISSWRDFLAAAELARPVLGISPSAWEKARASMGERHAAAVIAAIYQKQDEIRSPGGYLRNLTERSDSGKFSVWPMVMALLRAKLDGVAPAGEGSVSTAKTLVRVDKTLEVSSALLNSLKRRPNP